MSREQPQLGLRNAGKLSACGNRKFLRGLHWRAKYSVERACAARRELVAQHNAEPP